MTLTLECIWRAVVLIAGRQYGVGRRRVQIKRTGGPLNAE
jgi:hypothetical protein